MRLRYPAFLYKRSGDSVTLEPNRAGYNSSLMDANAFYTISIREAGQCRQRERSWMRKIRTFGICGCKRDLLPDSGMVLSE